MTRGKRNRERERERERERKLPWVCFLVPRKQHKLTTTLTNPEHEVLSIVYIKTPVLSPSTTYPTGAYIIHRGLI